MEFMHLTTGLPPYLPFARFLLKAKLSMTGKIVYALLLDRMTLSQKNGWADEEGRSYILYPIEAIARDIDRGQSAVKSALKELSAMGLIVRRRTGFDRPNRIYVLLPEQTPTVGNPTCQQGENQPSMGREDGGRTVRNPAPNHRKKNHMDSNQKKREEGLSPRGQYGNVFLSDREYEEIKAAYPQTDAILRQLSIYMKASGKCYADHAAALRLWLSREKDALPAYTVTEGDSL